MSVEDSVKQQQFGESGLGFQKWSTQIVPTEMNGSCGHLAFQKIRPLMYSFISCHSVLSVTPHILPYNYNMIMNIATKSVSSLKHFPNCSISIKMLIIWLCKMLPVLSRKMTHGSPNITFLFRLIHVPVCVYRYVP